MSNPTVDKHPMIELLGSMLHGIEVVPIAEQKRMVARACREAAHKYDEAVANETERCAKIAESRAYGRKPTPGSFEDGHQHAVEMIAAAIRDEEGGGDA